MPQRPLLLKTTALVLFVIFRVIFVEPIFAQSTEIKHSTNKSQHLCQNFIPHNNKRYPIKSFEGLGLNKIQFYSAIEKFKKVFEGDASELGYKLQIHGDWESEEANAEAIRIQRSQLIVAHGGLVRHPLMTADAFSLVLCHEYGHHNGGYPKASLFNDPEMTEYNWATLEGGADYYATLKCARKLFAGDNNFQIIMPQINYISEDIKQLCRNSFKNPNDIAICIRTAAAVKSLANVFSDLMNESQRPSLHTKDKTVIKNLELFHPSSQCRMDTLMAGLTCSVDVNQRVSDSDYKKDSCHETLQPNSKRPACWFH